MSKPPSIAACIAGAHCSAFGVRSTAHARYFLKVSITFSIDSGDFMYAAVRKPRRAVCIERPSICARGRV
jgi:hypothetical protein